MEEFKFLRPRKKKHPKFDREFEYLDKQNAVSILVFTQSLDEVILVKQFRMGSNKEEIEVVAGLLEKNEDVYDAVYRELREETGYTKDMVEEIKIMPNPLYVSPGYTTEKMYVFATRIKDDNVKPLPLKLDECEDVEVVKMKIEDVIKNSTDMKTVLSILYFKDIYTNV